MVLPPPLPQNESTMGEDTNFSPGAEERPQQPCQARVEEESKEEDGNSIVRIVEPGTERVDDHTNETGDTEASVTRVEERRSYYQAIQAHLVGSRNNDPEEERWKVKEQAEQWKNF